MSNDNEVKWMSADRPVEFGVSTEGELLISWAHTIQFPGLQGLGQQTEMRIGVRIPASEVPKLKLGLEQSRDIQAVLVATPPTQSKH